MKLKYKHERRAIGFISALVFIILVFDALAGYGGAIALIYYGASGEQIAASIILGTIATLLLFKWMWELWRSF